MGKDARGLPKLGVGASRAETQAFLFQLFSQGHRPTDALKMLKSARGAGEAKRASAGSQRAPVGAAAAQDED